MDATIIEVKVPTLLRAQIKNWKKIENILEQKIILF